MLSNEERRNRSSFRNKMFNLPLPLNAKETTVLTVKEFEILNKIEQLRDELIKEFDDNTEKIHNQKFYLKYQDDYEAYLRRKI
jgi:hypothetical protein